MRSSVLKQEPDPTEATECQPTWKIDLSILPPRERVAVACDGVIDIAAALFNVSGKEMREPGRSPKSVSRVRQIAMYVAHVELGLCMRDVGDGFGRDRTTVLYACHQVEDLRDDADFDAIVARMERVVTTIFVREGRR